MSTQAREMKAKINKWDLITLTRFLNSEGNNKTKRQPRDWEKIFAKDLSDRD